ncbi:MAG: hypothetical protein J0L72_10530 [Armatimonadetes bacterium]|nr:hypothetical protein [Armatimonadota bacterium]
MAKVKLSAFSTALSGKLGNLTFSNTKEGTIMRERISPKNPRTPAQQAVRAAFTKATKQWANLTTANVTNWENFAAGYETTEETTEKRYKSSGFNAFVKLAAKFYAVNPSGTAPANPPTSSFAGDTISVAASASTGSVKFTATGANASGVTTALLLARTGGKNRKANAEQYREKAYFTFASGSLSTTVSVPAGYYAAGYSFINTATGQESEPVLLGNIGGVTYAVEGGGKAPSTKKKAA